MSTLKRVHECSYWHYSQQPQSRNNRCTSTDEGRVWNIQAMEYDLAIKTSEVLINGAIQMNLENITK